MTQESSTLNNSSFQLYILKEDLSAFLGADYKAEESVSKLNAMDTSDSRFTIGLDQIEEYDWDLQTITLTNQATDDLLDTLATQSNTESVELTKLKSSRENLGDGNPIDRALYIHGFIVKTNGQSKYSGIFLNLPSQRAIDFPAIGITLVDGKVVFALLPTYPYTAGNPSESSSSVKFRAMMLNENIREIFKNAGKLKE